MRTWEDVGACKLQAACWETMEEFRRVAGQRKVARVDSARELAEWGGCAGNGRTCNTRSDWAVLAIGGTLGCSTINPTDPMV